MRDRRHRPGAWRCHWSRERRRGYVHRAADPARQRLRRRGERGGQCPWAAQARAARTASRRWRGGLGQLAARGERVLLLAPMHVAVDEALRRVGHADGVLALRASYDDSKVREELRRFTKSRLTAEFVRKARTPQTARSGRWRAEAAALRG